MAMQTAHSNSFHFTGAKSNLRAAVSRWLDGFFQAMEQHASQMPFARKIRALEAKSDAELAQMGLTRADIPLAVLRTYSHI
ncbi:hypothetical protein [Aliiroseovarius crassostreae]|uniref:hypothetical protein n=1 Tax=Aliiroseovarius crassostreae TaxID=154981 RepID=UPI002200F63B|nr:hypothetical protein [Aliiroseovarius crassostreae]UWQ05327.1 hypothetical protein K3X22_02315 [Aliiroseovarius crassostreae]